MTLQRHTETSLRARALIVVTAFCVATGCTETSTESTTSPKESTETSAKGLPSGVTGTSGVTASPQPADQPDPTQSLPTIRVTSVATLDNPTALVARPGSTTMYATELSGAVIALTPTSGKLSAESRPALDLTEEVGEIEGEQGLLGLAFSPDGEYLFVSHTDGDRDGESVIARYSMSGDKIDPDSRLEILRLKQPFSNHNGGHLEFGPDGMLFIGFGDGGGQGDPSGNSQNLKTLLGKLLRIDVSAATRAEPYAIPADNPFAPTSATETKQSATTARPEIWSYGLRNPWRFALTSAGDLWIADVGGSETEEVDWVRAQDGGGKGANFGWSLKEGSSNTDASGDRPEDLVDPVLEYGHDEGSSITGGRVVRGASLPGLEGFYIFSDFSVSELRLAIPQPDGSVRRAKLETTGEKLGQIVSFGEDNDGALYAVSIAGPILELSIDNG